MVSEIENHLEDCIYYVLKGDFYDLSKSEKIIDDNQRLRIKILDELLTSPNKRETYNSIHTHSNIISKTELLINFINNRIVARKIIDRKVYIINPVTPKIEHLILQYDIDFIEKYSDYREISQNYFLFVLSIKLAEIDEGYSANKKFLRRLISLYNFLHSKESYLGQNQSYKKLKSKLKFLIFKILCRFKEDNIEISLDNAKSLDFYRLKDELIEEPLFKELVESIEIQYFNFKEIDKSSIIDKLTEIKKNEFSGFEIHSVCKSIRKLYENENIDFQKLNIEETKKVLKEILNLVKENFYKAIHLKTDTYSLASSYQLIYNVLTIVERKELIKNDYKDFDSYLVLKKGEFNDLNSEISFFFIKPYINLLETFKEYIKYLRSQNEIDVNEIDNIQTILIDINNSFNIYYNKARIGIERAEDSNIFPLYIEIEQCTLSNGIFVDSSYILPSNYDSLKSELNNQKEEFNSIYNYFTNELSRLSKTKIDRIIEEKSKEYEIKMQEKIMMTVSIFTAVISFIISFSNNSITSKFDSIELVLYYNLFFACSLCIFVLGINTLNLYRNENYIAKKDWRLILVIVILIILALVIYLELSNSSKIKEKWVQELKREFIDSSKIK